MIDLNTRVSIPNDVLFHELDGEAVLLQLQSGKYYGLDPIGTRIWSLLAQNGSLLAAYQVMMDEYDIDEARLQADLLALVERLVASGLIQLDQPAK